MAKRVGEIVRADGTPYFETQALEIEKSAAVLRDLLHGSAHGATEEEPA